MKLPSLRKMEAAPAIPVASANDLALEVAGLRIALETRHGGFVEAVRGISFSVSRGKWLGIIGESGSGKTLTALSLMRLLPRVARISAGRISLAGTDITALSESEMEHIRGRRVSIVYQDPISALNPVQPIGAQVVEAVRAHRLVPRRAAEDRAFELLREVGLRDPGSRMREYPHQLSGGMRQRVVIAMAMACEPELLIADEPTSALDVTTQARILDLLGDLSARHGTTVILITHDITVAASVCDDVQVMYAGKIVESTTAEALRERAVHPYTEALLKSICDVDVDVRAPLPSIEGQPPSPDDLPAGCAFHTRCPYAIPLCEEADPALETVGAAHDVACHVVQKRFTTDVEHGFAIEGGRGER